MPNFLAPGLYVRNESNHAALFTLSQLTILHWAVVEPGQTLHVPCGRVFFTAGADYFDEQQLPSAFNTGLRIGGIALASVAFGFPGFMVSSAISIMTRGSGRDQKFGVYADGKVVVLKNKRTSSGAIVLQVDRLSHERSILPAQCQEDQPNTRNSLQEACIADGSYVSPVAYATEIDNK